MCVKWSVLSGVNWFVRWFLVWEWMRWLGICCLRCLFLYWLRWFLWFNRRLSVVLMKLSVCIISMWSEFDMKLSLFGGDLCRLILIIDWLLMFWRWSGMRNYVYCSKCKNIVKSGFLCWDKRLMRIRWMFWCCWLWIFLKFGVI